MFGTKFGIEIEFTGIPRNIASLIAAGYLNGESRELGDGNYVVTAEDGREWRFVYDGSINTQKDVKGVVQSADSFYSVELVSPILTYYEDIYTLQGLVREMRISGGFVNNTCGIHIHLDGANHTPRSLRNFINLIASRNDLFYKALQIPVERMRYCKKMDSFLVSQMNKRKPKTLKTLEKIWYEGYEDERPTHKYHHSRYHFLNLHSFFNGNGTVELRGFNSSLHAGKIRSYIVFALAMNHQALIQKSASSRRVQSENERFAMRVYLVRIGLSGNEFKNCRRHLYAHLSGNSAWRYGSKEECRSRRRKYSLPEANVIDNSKDSSKDNWEDNTEDGDSDNGNSNNSDGRDDIKVCISDILKTAEIRCMEDEYGSN